MTVARVIARCVGLAALLAPAPALGVPPYVTDDPVPVAYRHWEIDFASQWMGRTGTWIGTLPHVEVNWGALKDLEAHVLTPLVLTTTSDGRVSYGYSDTEIGVKYRFLRETKYGPMIGIFPSIVMPTGNDFRNLGNGSAILFLPVWIQKTFGKWTTNLGGGAWIDLGDRDRHWWLFGWQFQRRLSKHFTVGAEIFDLTADHEGLPNDLRFNIGTIIDFGDTHHLLFSAGRSLVGPVLFQSYIAWQLTFETKAPKP